MALTLEGKRINTSLTDNRKLNLTKLSKEDRSKA